MTFDLRTQSPAPEPLPRAPIWLHGLLFALIALVVLLIGRSAIDKSHEDYDAIDPQNNDGRQNLTYAYNLVRYGMFSRSEADRPGIPPDYFREPVYPALMALSLRLFADMEGVSHICFVQEDACGRQRQAAKRTDIGLLLVLSWALAAATYRVTRRWLPAYLAVGLLLSANYFFLNKSFSELPAALFLLLHAWLLYEALQSPARSRLAFACALLSSFALGLLILTKGIFLYWLIVLVAGLMVDVLLRRSRALTSVVTLLLLPAVLIAGLWMLRNVVKFDRLTLTSRSSSVLAVRAEYAFIEPNELRGAFVHFSSVALRPFLRDLLALDPADYARIDRDNDGSYFRRVIYGEADSQVIALARARYGLSDLSYITPGAFIFPDLTAADDAAMSAAATRILLDRWDKQLLLTLVFAYRGAFVTVERYAWSYDAAQNAALLAIRLLAISFVPALLSVSIWALRQRRYALLMFFVPALFSYGFHALATHYISRYSAPLVPVFIVALMLLLTRLAGWVTGAVRRRRAVGNAA